MFRVLFIFLVLGLSLYSLWSVFSPMRSISGVNSENLDFDSYLSQALERNTSKSESVIFDVSEFIDDTVPSGDTNDNTSSHTQTGEGEQGNSSNQVTFGNMNSTSTDELSSLIPGSFGTPQTQKFTGDTPINCDGGLLYDPCLVVGDPIPASGQMYFGSDQYTSL